jgi:hypothetical protein
MDDEYFEADIIFDELLADEMDCRAEDAYDIYREKWSNALEIALIQVYNDFVKPATHGYYSGRPEKFLEHSVQVLKEQTKCKLQANDDNIIACIETTKIET